MAIYLPITNPLRLWPLTELNPRTIEVDYCRPKICFTGEAVYFQIIVDATAPISAANVAFVEPDGTRYPQRWAGAGTGTAMNPQWFSGVMGASRSVAIFRIYAPDLPLFRLEFDFAPDAGGGRFVSQWMTTSARRSDVVKIRYYAYADGGVWEPDPARVALDTYWPKKPTEGDYFPVIYVPGGFFTSGFKPAIDDDSYMTDRYVSRYTHAYPRVSRTLVIGDARGVDNALIETLNAALSLNFEIEGRRYVRYDGAQLEPIGDATLPLNAWSVALQAADGGTSVLWTPGDTVAGTVIDAGGRYVIDAAGKYVKS